MDEISDYSVLEAKSSSVRLLHDWLRLRMSWADLFSRYMVAMASSLQHPLVQHCNGLLALPLLSLWAIGRSVLLMICCDGDMSMQLSMIHLRLSVQCCKGVGPCSVIGLLFVNCSFFFLDCL
ncbi:hypothetical protein MANES_01G045180v8 [Manihot esculenta]|uniref:Uncharacterized protein n=1 Tax=Manihot esculenta TaxID=3983 RepID=A0ACB7IAM5_MANES|nr:hypothetical protein MANES_01G045180v8 [Manihot esculenta]